MTCFIYCYAECHNVDCCYTDCHYADCHYTVIMLTVVMLTVMVPHHHWQSEKDCNADTWSKNFGGWIESKDIPISAAVATNEVHWI